jgi:hypothetical protein
VNREDGDGESRPVEVLRTLYLVGKLVVVALALVVLFAALGVRPRRLALA